MTGGVGSIISTMVRTRAGFGLHVWHRAPIFCAVRFFVNAIAGYCIAFALYSAQRNRSWCFIRIPRYIPKVSTRNIDSYSDFYQ